MKNSLLVFGVLVLLSKSLEAQVNLIIEAPQNNASTTQLRAPNGTAASAYMNACALVLQSELTNLPSGSNISSFGFTLSAGTAGIPVTGNFTVYLQNTTDLTYQKGISMPAALVGMTSVYASVMTIPLSATTTSILLTLSTPFTYNGGGLYVAYEWYSSGPYSATPATYLAESVALNPGCASAVSAVSSPTALATTAFRPAFLFGAANTNTNDIQVIGFDLLGKVSAIYNSPQAIKATIYNASNISKSNFSVSLNASGSNPTTGLQGIAVLAAGAFTTVTFNGYNPSIVGSTNFTVSVDPDQNNINNSKTQSQLVNCNFYAKNPPTGTFTSQAVGFGAGSGILGYNFTNPASCLLNGLNLAISSNAASVGNQVYGALLSNAGSVIATTNTLTITSAMLGTFQQFLFSSPPPIAGAAFYVLGFAQMTGSAAYYPAGTQASAYVTPNIYVTCPLAGGALTPLTQNFGYFGIEAIFSHTANVTLNSLPICIGNSATLTAVGPVSSYSWNTGANTSSIVVSPTVNTNYSVVTSNSIGCISQASIILTVSTLPIISVNASSYSVCPGASVTLSGNGAVYYSWSTGATTSSVIVNPTVTSTYTLMGANAIGCINSTLVSINVDAPVFSLTSNTSVCDGSSITLTTTASSPYTYVWSTGWSSPVLLVTPTTNTVYSVTATDPNLCTTTQSVLVTVNPNPTVTATAPSTNICIGEALIISATGAITYTWSNSIIGNTIQIIPNQTGSPTYSVIGSNSFGCQNESSISIKVSACLALNRNELPNISVSIFPNPSQGSFEVRLEGVSSKTDIKVFNATGQLLIHKHLMAENAILYLEDLSDGLYFVKFYQEGELVHSAKLLKN